MARTRNPMIRSLMHSPQIPETIELIKRRAANAGIRRSIALLRAAMGPVHGLGTRFNPFGRTTTSGGATKFNSIPESIDNQGSYLKRMYFDQGQTTPSDLGWVEWQAVESRHWPYAFLSVDP
jgi:hypothetical protein